MRAIEVTQDANEHSAPITSVALRADGVLATGSYDGTVRTWSDPGSRGPATSTFRHRRLVNCVAWNPVRSNVLASGSADKTVAIWDVDTDGDPILAVLSRHTDDINSVSWMPDGRRLVCVSEDGHVTIWDTETSTLLGTLGSHRAHCMAVAVNRNGSIASVGEDGLVRVVADQAPADDDADAVERTYRSSIEGCAWSSNGDLLALALDEGKLEVVAGNDLATVETYELSSSAVRSVAWASNDQELIAGTYDGRVYHVDRGTGRVTARRSDRAWPRSIDAGSGMVAVGSFTSRPHVYVSSSAEELLPAAGRGLRGPNAAAVFDDRIAIGTDSGEVLMLDVDDLRERGVVKVGDSPILGLSASATGLVGTTYSGHVFLVAGSEVVARSENLSAPLPSVAATQNEVLVGSYGGELVLLDSRSLSVVRRRQVHDGSIKSIAALGNGDFVTGSTDRQVSLVTRELEGRDDLWHHGNLVNAVAQLDASVVASASRDRTVRIGRIDAHGSTRPSVLLGPDESIKAVALVGTAERFMLIAGSYDFGLYWWSSDDAEKGAIKLGERFDVMNQAVSTIVPISSDEFICAGWDREIRKYRIRDDDAPELVATACLGVEV